MNTKEAARNRWKHILPALGVNSRFLTGKHGPCPFCEGRDRWRFDDKDGTGSFFCTNCGAGDGIKLVMLARHLDYGAACREIDAQVGNAPIEQTKPKRTEAAKRRTMRDVWDAGMPVTLDNAAGRYLNNRTGLRVFPKCLRFAERAIYKRQDGPTTWHPALLARVDDVHGNPCNVHRTFLDLSGAKAEVEDPKRLMEGGIPPGSAIRLLAPRDGVLGIAEGIETAVAAMMLFKVPVWATLNALRLETWTPPEGVTEVQIYGDHDASFTGQAAAYNLAKRLTGPKHKLKVDVIIPEVEGRDWADALVQLSRSAA